MATFIPNPASKVFLLTMVEPVLEAITELIADEARGFSPELTGDYIDGIGTADGDKPGEKKVVATDFKSGWIEFGTEDTPTFAPLQQGCDAAGYPVSGERDRT